MIRLVTDKEILSFAQLDAPFVEPGRRFEIGVLWEPAVIERRWGAANPVGATLRQVVEQQVGIVSTRATRQTEKRRGTGGHILTVLEQYATPEGSAGVFENAEFAGVVAHEVYAGDVA